MTKFDIWTEIIRLIILLLSGAAIPVVIFIIGNRYSRLREIEEKLRSERIEIYNKILEPYMLFFSTEEVIKNSELPKKFLNKTGVELAANKLLTLDYQEYCFKLSLIGSDSVIRAFNNIMQKFYNPEEDEQNKEKK